MQPLTSSNKAQWIFCNNHDNWRLQTLTGKNQLLMCPALKQEQRLGQLYLLLVAFSLSISVAG